MFNINPLDTRAEEAAIIGDTTPDLRDTRAAISSIKLKSLTKGVYLALASGLFGYGIGAVVQHIKSK
jgi:hypothetical protein